MTILEILRRIHGISQKKVAADLGISPTILSHVETRRRECYPKLRRKLSEYFGVEESELFDAEGWPLPVDEARVLEKVAK